MGVCPLFKGILYKFKGFGKGLRFRVLVPRLMQRAGDALHEGCSKSRIRTFKNSNLWGRSEMLEVLRAQGWRLSLSLAFVGGG